MGMSETVLIVMDDNIVFEEMEFCQQSHTEGHCIMHTKLVQELCKASGDSFVYQ